MRRNKIIIKLILIMLIGLSLLAGCDTLQQDRRLILVLIDYSASSSKKLNRYIDVINDNIFLNLGRNDCLIVMPIDEGSKREPIKLVFEDMMRNKFNSKSDGFTHAQDSVNLRMNTYFKSRAPEIRRILEQASLERKKYTNYTDIVGALEQSQNMLEKNASTSTRKKIWNFVSGHPEYKVENVIVLLSDMVQESPECNFNNKIGISRKKCNLYIKGLQEQGRIPDLTNCKLFVIGSTGKNSRQIDNIANFWKQYFQASHSELSAYGYDVGDQLSKYLGNKTY